MVETDIRTEVEQEVAALPEEALPTVLALIRSVRQRPSDSEHPEPIVPSTGLRRYGCRPLGRGIQRAAEYVARPAHSRSCLMQKSLVDTDILSYYLRASPVVSARD